MSLPQPPISQEQLEALPPETQALIAAIIKYYEQRLAELTAELAALKKTPRNSSLPPSTEHPHAKPPRDKKKSKKKRGGQRGHRKHERTLIPAEQCSKVHDRAAQIRERRALQSPARAAGEPAGPFTFS